MDTFTIYQFSERHWLHRVSSPRIESVELRP